MRPLVLSALVVAGVCGCAPQRFVYEPAITPERIEELVRTIDYDCDPFHSELTPSVRKLVEIGEPAIPRMLDLMLLDGKNDESTRLRAETVIYRIFLAKYGWNRPGPGWADSKDKERFDAFWKTMPVLAYDAPLEERERAVKAWREWLAKRKA